MLVLDVPQQEYFDQISSKFITLPSFKLRLVHSLRSLSAWEEEWEKPFLSNTDHTNEETLSYIKAMCVDSDVREENFDRLSQEHIDAIGTYINAKKSATWFTELPGQKPKAKSVITSEVVYSWMIAHQIPFEAQDWHLNRLLTLIRVCNDRAEPKKKVNKTSTIEQYRTLNAQRRAAMGTTG